MRTRNGFIFLYVLGILSITLAIAMALLKAAQSAHTGAGKIEMDTLANRAAKEAVQHAITAIRQQFAMGPGIPTQLNDRWRTHFLPIDATKVGYATVATGDDAPTGQEFTAEDFFPNDVPVENGLAEQYMEVDMTRGTYYQRTQRYNNGWYNHHGLARWFEPGVQTANPVAQPLSFHLPHPTPANGASPDPAVRAGENYAPDLDEPVWYDSQLIATTDVAKRRYRLRYAVAVEDLEGHLLTAVPGEFDVTATSVLTGSPSDIDRDKINEVDNSVADVYAGTMSNMFRYTGGRVWEWGDIGLRGLGATQQSMGYQLGYAEGIILASRNALGEMTYFDDADGGSKGPDILPVPGTDSRMNHESVAQGDYPAHYFNVGPFPSFQAMWHDASNVNTNFRPYLFTPFGRSPKKVDAPTAWNESRVDTPWRVNVPTMAPMALPTMVYGYMPKEFRTQGSDVKHIKDWDGVLKYFRDRNPPAFDIAATGSASTPTKFSAVNDNVEPFSEMASLAYFDQNGGVVPADPYPGTDPAGPGGHWLPNLGRLVLTNSALNNAGAGILFSTANYMSYDFGDKTVLSQRWVGGVNETLKPQVVRLDVDGTYKPRNYVSGFTADSGYYHHYSYWVDMAAAMIHAVAVSRFAWLDQVNGANAGDPTSGKPKWGAGIPNDYFDPAWAPEFVPGTLTRDHDIDGNGIKDSPSAFDTIAEIDRQFLRNLGEWPGDFALGARPVTACGALRSMPLGDRRGVPTVAYVDLQALGSKNIKMLRVAGTITLQQAALMELVVNDMRMSFLGSSPDYQDFRPLDLDDDGTVRSSAYPSGSAAADTANGRGPQPRKWFSLTGCFTLQKSRYYRIFTRGQLYDELRSVPVAETDMESVYVVDPDGDMWDIDDQPTGTTGNGMADSHLLFQRILTNRYLGTASHADN